MRQLADPGPTSTTAEITQKPMPINSEKPAAAAMAAPKSEIKTTEPKVSPQVTCQEWTHVEKGKTISAEPNRKLKRGSQFSSGDGDRDQSATSSTIEDSNRNSGTRGGNRDSGVPDRYRGERELIEKAARYIMNDQPPIGLTNDQKQPIHDAIKQKILEVEGGLSDLQKSFDGLEGNNWALVNDFSRKSQQSRPLDLLEVYRGPQSQLTQNILRYGGRAKRFSRRWGRRHGRGYPGGSIYTNPGAFGWYQSANCIGNFPTRICHAAWKTSTGLFMNDG